MTPGLPHCFYHTSSIFNGTTDTGKRTKLFIGCSAHLLSSNANIQNDGTSSSTV